MAQTAVAMKEDFAALLDESFKSGSIEGSVIKGTVVRIDDDVVLIDVGLKSEGRIPLKEFSRGGRDMEMSPGDRIDVYVERYEDRDGLIMLSRDKARREEAWNVLEEQYTKNTRVEGIIFGRVKGGFTVDLNGAVAFLPALRSISVPCATSPR
jgi:small subunit ribosomal protein S1